MKCFTVLLMALSSTALAATLGPFWGQSPLALPETGKPEPEPVPGQNHLRYCGPTDGDILEIKDVNITPDPLTPGATLLLEALGTLKEKIEPGAYVKIEVKYNKYIRLLHKELDLCENAGEVDMECPVKPGEVTVTKEVQLPNIIPPGTYHVQADVYTKDDRPITCLTTDITFHAVDEGENVSVQYGVS